LIVNKACQSVADEPEICYVIGFQWQRQGL
jgi:hypothetical protein